MTARRPSPGHRPMKPCGPPLVCALPGSSCNADPIGVLLANSTKARMGRRPCGNFAFTAQRLRADAEWDRTASRYRQPFKIQIHDKKSDLNTKNTTISVIGASCL